MPNTEQKVVGTLHVVISERKTSSVRREDKLKGKKKKKTEASFPPTFPFFFVSSHLVCRYDTVTPFGAIIHTNIKRRHRSFPVCVINNAPSSTWRFVTLAEKNDGQSENGRG